MASDKLKTEYDRHCHKNAELKLEIDNRMKNLNKIKEDLHILEKQRDKKYLQEKWCCDKDGSRTKSTLQDEMSKITERLEMHPELTEDVIQTLQGKKIELATKIQQLEDELKKIENG